MLRMMAAETCLQSASSKFVGCDNERMQTTLALVSLIATLTDLTPSGRVGAQASNSIEDPDAYAVYASVLSEPSLRRTDAAGFMLFEETKPHMDCLPRVAEREVGPEWAPVVANYREENARPRRLLPGFDVGVMYRLISRSELDQRLAEHPGVGRSNDGLVYAQFPGGKLLFLSAVGFDKTKTRALVTVQYTCGFDCSGGSHLLRVKEGPRWVQPAGDVPTCTWIS